ncbi:hypothetical protein FRC17_001931 [Serendipita sp. 399]|nr:hypothetical protein FRC17_001931 [Serendipita sp. 399]
MSSLASSEHLITDFSVPDVASNASFSGREYVSSEWSQGRAPSIISRGSVDSIELPEEIVRTEGLRHSDIVLNAKRYKTDGFMDKLLQMFQDLQIPTWSERTVASNASISSRSSTFDAPVPLKEDIWIHKVSGSLTNAVFFVLVPTTSRAEATSFVSKSPTRTVLLRIYGPSSSHLINRSAELRILHVLSSRYRIGPRVWGTFANGRVEEYFESEPLKAEEMRDPQISRWIAIRMSELHRVDVRKAFDPNEWADPKDGTRGELGVKRNIRSWLTYARDVVALIRDKEYTSEIDLDLFEHQWNTYYKWVRDWEKEESCEKESPRVFCHNDTQYGNLLKLKRPHPGMLPHQQIIVVDFEYASPNCAAFDIANHFCEWTTDYIGENPAILKPERYPTREERDNFFLAYLQSGLFLDRLPHGSSSSDSFSANRTSTFTLSGTDSTGTPNTTSNSSSITTDAVVSESPTSTSTPNLSRTPSTNQFSRHASSSGFPSTKTPQLTQFTKHGPGVLPEAMELLEEQVRRWMPASHAMYAVWSLVQARDDVERTNKKLDGSRGYEDGEEDVMEFDYLQYALCRIRLFRQVCKDMGVF